MPQDEKCTWTGESGKSYDYWVHEIGTSFKPEPGNYVFARLNMARRWEAIYVGQAENLSTRFKSHHQQPCIDHYSATHIHAHLNDAGDQARLDEETDIRRKYRPPCNQQ